MTIGYFPRQTADELPSWAAFGPSYGQNGRNGYRLTASGSRYCCLHYRFMMTQSTDISVETQVVMKNNLNQTANGYEGVTVYIRAFRISGGVSQRIWSNTVTTSGDTTKWHAENRGSEWVKFTIIEQLPDGLAPDAITVAVVAKAASGDAYIADVQCRNFYRRSYETDPVVAANSGTLPLARTETVDTGSQGTRRTFLWYLQTKPLVIRKGEQVEVRSNLYALAQTTRSAEISEFKMFVIAKLRRRTGQYDEIRVGESLSTSLTNSLPRIPWDSHNSEVSFVAGYEYTQFEWILGASITGTSGETGAATIGYKSDGNDGNTYVNRLQITTHGQQKASG